MLQRFHFEMRRPHPRFDSAERVLHCGAAHDHRIGALVEA